MPDGAVRAVEPKGVQETDCHTTGFAGSLCPAHNALREISIIVIIVDIDINPINDASVAANGT
jgi:hypothetical protein